MTKKEAYFKQDIESYLLLSIEDAGFDADETASIFNKIQDAFELTSIENEHNPVFQAKSRGKNGRKCTYTVAPFKSGGVPFESSMCHYGWSNGKYREWGHEDYTYAETTRGRVSTEPQLRAFALTIMF